MQRRLSKWIWLKVKKAGARDGISQELATGGVAAELAEEAEVWKSEIQDNDQKNLFRHFHSLL